MTPSLRAGRLLVLAAVLLAGGARAAATPASPFGPWINGVDTAEPPFQTQRYDADTYVIRQSVRTNFEAPFLYLLFGRDRALLLDTGAGGAPVRPAVEAAIADWARAHGRGPVPLVVAHSHGHGDHHQGDGEFAGRPETRLVGLTPQAVATAFGIADWPRQIVSFDLGGRILDILPTPGHEPAHIMVYDRRTGLLLSGDSLGPYRLYVPLNEAATYTQSIERAAAFARAHPVRLILGAHIEMTPDPGELIPDRAPAHPREHVLELQPGALFELEAALRRMDGTLVREAHPDFVIFPIPARPPPAAAKP